MAAALSGAFQASAGPFGLHRNSIEAAWARQQRCTALRQRRRTTELEPAMPVSAAALRPFRLVKAETGLAMAIYVVIGPLIGFLTLVAMGGGAPRWVNLMEAYTFGVGPAALCAILSLLAWQRLRHAALRLLAAPFIGAFCGVVGQLPAFLLVFGWQPASRDADFIQVFFGFSVIFSIVAALLCGVMIEIARLYKSAIARRLGAPAR